VPTDLYRFLDAPAGTPSLSVNGQQVPLDIRNGYARIRRTWQKGDAVELALPMPVRRIASHVAVAGNAGRVALQRGPIVFCLEGVDNDGCVFDLFIPDAEPLRADPRPDLLNGVVVLAGSAVSVSKDTSGKTVESPRPFRAVPYYAWANRGRTEMLVWLPRTAAAVKPPARLDRTVD
jgi:uncharacterized protein